MVLKALIEKQLRDLEYELRVELPREIKTALAMGDLRENAEYQAALERQGLVQARVGQLKQRLADISLIRIDKVPKDRINLGSWFRAIDVDSDEEVEFEVVMEGMGDPSRGRISISSLLARGFVNKKVGDEVTISVPSGTRSYEILAFKSIHDRKASVDPDQSDT